MIIATLANGSEVVIDPSMGANVRDLLDNLTSDSLTGSAVPLADVVLLTSSGRDLPYADVQKLEDVSG